MVLHPVFSFRELGKRFRDALVRREDAALKELLAKTSEEDAVHVIESLPDADRRRTFRMLAADRQARMLLELSAAAREAVMAALGAVDIKAMIDAVESDEAVDVIQELDEPRRARVIEDLKKADPRGLLPLLVFGEETAGGIMKTELMRFRAHATVDEVRRQLAVPGRPKSHVLYVVDDADVLVGTLQPLKLLQSPAGEALSSVMTPPAVTLAPTVDQEEVARVFDEHNAIELPVVGPKGRLLGCITADDVLEVMEEEYAEDVARLVGVGEDDRLSDPVHLTVRRRLPWLVVNLGTAILAASVVGLFQETIQRVVILAAFMPIVAGMGGNAATQTLGVVVRAIALGELRHVRVARALGRQMLAGALNGFLTGLVMGGLAFWWTGDWKLAGVIAVAMTANMLIAGAGGVIVPLTLKSMRVDPALASSVFVTTLTDVCGFFVFLGLATALL